MRIAHRFIGGEQSDDEQLLPGRLNVRHRMGHTYISNLVHYVFSTKHRQKLITPQLEVRLWPYMGGIARENGMKAISIGGTEDHILYPRSSTLSSVKPHVPHTPARQSEAGDVSVFVAGEAQPLKEPLPA